MGEIQSEREWRGREGGRECEGEIKEVWFSSTQLLTATAVTSLHLFFALPLLSSSILSFLPTFLPFSIPSFLLDACQISINSRP